MLTYGVSISNNKGELIEIKTTTKQGQGILTVNGHMSEDILNSVKNALHSIDIPTKTDIDIYISGGQLPLSGPSLGLAILNSIKGAIKKEQSDNDVVYTGSIDTEGNVHPVGGMTLKEQTAIRHNKSLKSN